MLSRYINSRKINFAHNLICWEMQKRIYWFLQYFIFWFVFFLVNKVFFLIYEFKYTTDLSVIDILKVFIYGSRMDASVAGYFTILPGILLIFSFSLNDRILNKIVSIYTCIVIFIFEFLTIIDLELYRFWGFRLDTTPLMYLKTPKEAFASANYFTSIALIIFWIVFSYFTFKFYKRFLGGKILEFKPVKWFTAPVFAFLSAVLIIPVRGSFGVAPMNLGFVYFSKTSNYANHATVNVFWNLSYSLTKYNQFNPVIYMDQAEAESLFKENFNKKPSSHKLLNTTRPNIIFIIMESFSNKLIEPLGGLKGVTPNINRFMHEGIVFSNCFAAGDRTDKGIVSVICGYPPLAQGAIINFPTKIEKLPCFNSDLKKQGYYSQFLLGFDTKFANLNTLFLHANFDKVISKEEFPESEQNSKWGAHDEYLLNRLFEECNKAPSTPFFMANMTQSSHEPFDVPMKTVFPGSDDDNRFINAAYYTDSCLGVFIKKAQTAPWWKNTLIVLVADHGNRLPGNTPNNLPPKFHIPMIWLGGALAAKDTVVDTYFSQNDLPFTLLHQMDIDNPDYLFSKDFLTDNVPAFGFSVFNNGFAIINKDGYVQVDNDTHKATFSEGKDSSSLKKLGEAIMQKLTTDFNKR
jgi:phosphoglycerol transferase MdoB-like AlkP superfamily enzyme